MKTLQNVNEKTRKMVTPLIEYLDQYYVYNEEVSNKENLICYGDSLSFVKLNVSDEKLEITYSNFTAIIFIKNNYPLATIDNNSAIFNYDHSLPYIMLYVTFDKCLDL